MKNPDEMLTIKEVARELGYSVGGVRKLLARGLIRYSQAAPNCRVLIRRAELARAFPNAYSQSVA